jgi:hypothetical protein
MLRQVPVGRALFTVMAVLVVVVVIGLALGHSSRAFAKPCFSIDTAYYSDASFTTQVGERYIPCDGQTWSWGTTSPYYETTTEPCGGWGCPG